MDKPKVTVDTPDQGKRAPLAQHFLNVTRIPGSFCGRGAPASARAAVKRHDEYWPGARRPERIAAAMIKDQFCSGMDAYNLIAFSVA